MNENTAAQTAAISNKQILQSIFAELAAGNSGPFVDSMADDFTWIVKGSTKWSPTYEGKQSVLTELLAPLRDQLAGQYSNTAHRFVADDDLVVVECRGSSTTKAGEAYNNEYCFIFRLSEGKLKEVTEYMDTHLVETVLNDPKVVSAI